MKRLIIFALVIAALLCVCGFIKVNTDTNPWTNRQQELHELANMARSMGLPEDSPIILEASRLWWSEQRDLQIIANVILHEAPYCTDRHQQLVAMVLLNRTESPLFPDTVFGNVCAPMQYNPAYTTNLPPLDSTDPEVQRAFKNAIKAINGEVDCPENVLYQSEFKNLGSGNYETITVDTGWYSSTTYFNYG